MHGLAGLAAALAVQVGLLAAAPPRAAKPGPPPAPPPPPVVYEQTTFQVALPPPWRRVDQSDCVRDASVPSDYCYGLARFEDDRGGFFQVLVDYPPTEASANAYWTLAASPDGATLAIAREEAMRPCPLTLEGEARCDPRKGFVIAAWIELGGHHYLFSFGNASRRKGVPLDVFREILRSFRTR
jgi:hypothetical protein